jgi:hypothetical protein
MGNGSKLKFVLLVNSPSVACWEFEVIQHLLATQKVEPVLCVVKKITTDQRKPSFFFRLSRFIDRNFFWKVYRKMTGEVPSLKTKENYSLEQLCKLVAVEPIQHGKNRESFQSNDLAMIRSYHPDFILRFGFDILLGEILGLAKHGVWSYHHDHPEVIRGGPQGFWEVFLGHETTGLVLQCLNEKLDEGQILRRGNLRTVLHSYRGNLEQLMQAGVKWPAQVVEEIMAGNFGDASQYVGPAKKGRFFSYPDNKSMIQFFLQSIYRRAKFHWRDLFFAEKWNVGFLKGVDFFTVTAVNAQWLKEMPRGVFLADPFPVASSLNQLFVEYYAYQQQKGEIHCLDFNGNLLNKTLVFPHHLSFPFNLSHEGKNYLMPEQASSCKVECIEALHPAQPLLLLEGIEAVDPNLIFFEGKFWLFCTDERKGANAHLCLYFADRLEGPFVEHPQSPVKTDVAGARPAGEIIMKDNKLYRPGQNCAPGYGASVIWFEIEEINEQVYKEKKVAEIRPDVAGPYPHGLHTMNRIQEGWVIDGKRFEFSFWHSFHKIKQKF